MSSGDLPFEGRDRHIQRARIPWGAERPEAELAVRESFTRIERPAENVGECVRLLQKVAEWAAARLVQTEREQVLRGDIGIDRAKLRIEHDDPGRQGIEQIRRIEVRERRRQGVLSDHGAPWGALRRLPSTRAPSSGFRTRRIRATLHGRHMYDE